MALEEIIKIKKAEEEAEDMINTAKSKASASIKKAREEADFKYDEILKNAVIEKDRIISDEIKKGNDEAKKIYAQGEKELYSIKNINSDTKENAVKIIVERVVKCYGDS